MSNKSLYKYDYDEDEWLKSRPKCTCCKKPIEADSCFVIEDEILCDECLKENLEGIFSDYFLKDCTVKTEEVIERLGL